jgi:hypothetical protein
MKIFYTFLSLTCLCCTLSAQVKISGNLLVKNRQQVHVLATTRGDKLVGKVLSYDTGTFVFKLNTKDVLKFPFAEVDSITAYWKRDLKPGSYRPSISERVLFSPTAFSLRRGQQEFHNLMLVYSGYNYGVSDRFTVGVRVLSFPEFFGTWAHVKWAKPIAPGLQVGAGSLLGGGFSSPYSEGGKINYHMLFPYMALTVGNRDYFLNFTLAKGFSDEEGDTDVSPWMPGISGAIRVGNRMRFFAEYGSYEPGDEYGRLGNFGLTILGKRQGLDVGLLLSKDIGWFPILAYTNRF